MWHGYNKRLFCKPDFLGNFNTSGPVYIDFFCLGYFLDNILGVLHLTFSSFYDASNSPGLLMVVHKETIAKQLESTSLPANNGGVPGWSLSFWTGICTFGHVSENHCPCKVLSLFLAYRTANHNPNHNPLIIILALTEENTGITNIYCGTTVPVVFS